MKKLLMVLTVLILSVQVFASENPVAKGNFGFTVPLFQHAKGSGDLYKSDADMSSSSVTTFGLGSVGFSYGAISYGSSNYNTGIQYFIADGLAIGADLGYLKIEIENDNLTVKTAGPQVEYYINLNPALIYAGAGYTWKSVKMGEDSEKLTITSLTVKGGLAYMVGQNLALFGEGSYSFDKWKVEDEDVKGKWMAITAGVKAFF